MAKKETETLEQQRDYTPELPKQVKKQVEEAEALLAQMNQKPADTAPPAAPEGATEAAPPEGDLEGQPPQPEASPPAEDDGQSWEQRFRSQQGRLEQATRTNMTLNERLGQLEELVATLKIKGAEEQKMDAPAPKTYERLLSEQELNDYGDEFLQVVGKKSREELQPEFESLAERLQRIEGRLEGVGTVMERSAVQELYAGLADNVPDWRAINHSEQFKSWLQVPDPFSGRIRHDMLTEAFSRHETGRVINFFRGFLAEATGLPQNTSSPGSSAPPPANGSGSGKPSLESFAAPGRARSAPQALPPDKPIYTPAWIEKFMADKRTGKYRGREADADAIERDIFQAQHEGRITQ